LNFNKTRTRAWWSQWPKVRRAH